MKPYSRYWKETAWSLMGFVPNPTQYVISDWWFEAESRFALIMGGERAGKSLLASALALPCMGPTDEGDLYWIVGPDYAQARPEFMYIYEALKDGNLIEGEPSMPQSSSAQWSFRSRTGFTVATRSSGDITKLASYSVKGFLMTEAAQQQQEVWLKLMGRVSETQGFGILSGTLEQGLPWYQDLYQRWRGENELGARSFSLPTWSNIDVYPLGREDPAIKELESEYPPDVFDERFAAVPKRHAGVVIPEFDYEEHVKKLDTVPSVPVELWIDPGTTTYAVLFVQCIGLYTNVLDRVYERNAIAHDIIPKVMGNPLFQYVEKERAGVMDFAGNQRHGNKSQIQLWREIGGCSLATRYIHEKVTIDTIRYRMRKSNVHHEPLVFFNSHFTNQKTPNGESLDVLAEFELWRWPTRGFTRNEPQRPIDKSNHALKALGYGLVHHYGEYIDKPRTPPPKKKRYWIAV